MKFILGGVLEYRNADCRHHHIHEHDVTSSLKGKRKRLLDLFSSGFFLLEEYIKNSENDVDQREQSCQRQSACTSVLEVSITGVQAVRCLLVLAKKRFRECGKTNTYSANIEFNVSAHGEHTSHSVKGKQQRRILTGDGPWCLFTTTGVVRLAIDEVTTNVRISRSV